MNSSPYQYPFQSINPNSTKKPPSKMNKLDVITNEIPHHQYQEIHDQMHSTTRQQQQQQQPVKFHNNYLHNEHYLRHSSTPQDVVSSPLNINYFHHHNFHYDALSSQPLYLPLLQDEVSERFPVEFNPRASPNMPHREKVNRWIKEVPVSFLCRDEDGVEVWQSECYPAVIPLTSGSSSSFGSFPNDYKDISGGVKGKSGKGKDLFVDYEDVLEFQSFKITEYVRRLYDLDQRDVVYKLKTVYDYDDYSDGEIELIHARHDYEGDEEDEGVGAGVGVGVGFNGDLNLEFFEDDKGFVSKDRVDDEEEDSNS